MSHTVLGIWNAIQALKAESEEEQVEIPTARRVTVLPNMQGCTMAESVGAGGAALALSSAEGGRLQNTLMGRMNADSDRDLALRLQRR